MSRAIRVLFLHINMSVSRSERVLDLTITGFTLPLTACTTLLLLIIYILKVKKKTLDNGYNMYMMEDEAD